jgi:hypothetical protein
MARYFFDLYDNHHSLRDDEGTETDDLQEVHDEAISALPDMVKEALPDGDHRVFAVKVRDTRDRVIFTASLVLDARWIGFDPIAETIPQSRQP